MINPDDVIRKFYEAENEHRNLIDEFFSPAAAGRRFVIGRNESSMALSKLMEINGVIDDFSSPGNTWQGLSVLKGSDIPKDAIIVNCSTSISPVSAAKRASELGSSLAYADLNRSRPESVPLSDFVSDTREDLRQNRAKWEIMSQSLEDSTSRQVLDDLIQYRLTGDCRFMSGYSVRFKDQYFEDFLNLDSGEVFVDCGGFDGDTTEEFCRRYPTYEKVFLFEPSGKNIQKARERLKNYRSINFIELGISDTPGVLSFDPDAGSASAVDETGSCKITVTTLDEHLNERVTFIKMDLEGWEIKALAGAKQHILQDHPKLAISVYHHPSDFWRIYEYVMGLRQDYKVYLRHYTQGWSETVMFFLPQ